MASNTASGGEDGEQLDEFALRLPPYFPKVPKACIEVSKPFFECFNEGSKYNEGMQPNVGRVALKNCWDKIEAYTKCAEANLTDKQKTLFQAPSFYRDMINKETKTSDGSLST